MKKILASLFVAVAASIVLFLQPGAAAAETALELSAADAALVDSYTAASIGAVDPLTVNDQNRSSICTDIAVGVYDYCMGKVGNPTGCRNAGLVAGFACLLLLG